jgi:hypothetical protein
VFGSYFERFYVIIFWGKDQPQSEGSRHTDHGVKLLPDVKITGSPPIPNPMSFVRCERVRDSY